MYRTSQMYDPSVFDVHNCPKCGSDDVDLWYHPSDDDEHLPAHVLCLHCGARSATFPTPTLAAIVWNINPPGLIKDGCPEKAQLLQDIIGDFYGSYDDVINAVEWANKKRPLPLNGLVA